MGLLVLSLALGIQGDSAGVGASVPSLVDELPTGLIGLWVMDQYAASPRPAVPNMVSAVPLSANLLGMSRRHFNRTQFWAKTTTTVADETVADPGGLTQASTFAGTSNWRVGPVGAVNIAAGTYTLAVNVRRNDVTDQPFAFSNDNLTTRSATQTATASWQRFSHTFTLGAPALLNRLFLCSSDGTTGANLQVVDFELYGGSVDLGPQTLAGHLYLGRNAVDLLPTFSGGALDFSSGRVGFIQFPETTTLQNLTAVAIVEKAIAGASPSFQGFLSRVQTHTNFTAYMEQTSLPMAPSSQLYVGGMLNLYELHSQGYHMITQRTNTVGSRTDMFIDTCKFATRSVAPASSNCYDLGVSYVSAITLTANYRIAAIALWNRSLSDAEIRA